MHRRWSDWWLLAIVLAVAACDFAQAPENPPEQLATQRASLPTQGPYVDITSPSMNRYINLDGPGPTVITIQYDYLPHPDDTTGGLVLFVDAEEPLAVDNPGDPIELEIDIGMHALVLQVTDDEGAPYGDDGAASRVVIKVSAPCSGDAECRDSNPCSSDFCMIVGVEWRCQYATTPGVTCCLSAFDCSEGKMCIDLFPLNSPDGIRECIECDGTPDNCPLRPCEDAYCHPDAFDCRYTRRDDCCVPGVDTCPFEPCEGCVSEDGFEGVCGQVGESGSCCFQDEGGLGAPDYGCETTHPCFDAACVDGGCRFAAAYAGCCAADEDCVDVVQVNACTGPTGICQEIDPVALTGTCAYPYIVPGCCVNDADCDDQLPAASGTCDRAPGAESGSCVYEANPEFCDVPAPGVFINEAQIVSPAGLVGEWIEIYNGTATTVELQGWRIESLANPANVMYLTGAGALPLAPGRLLVVGQSTDPEVNGGAPVEFASFGLDMGLSDEGLRLVDAFGSEADQFVWGVDYPLISGSAVGRTSPYRPTSEEGALQSGSAVYGPGGAGSPGRLNLGLYDPFYSAPHCDDGDPCTLDICNSVANNICSHLRIEDCCSVEEDPACDDGDVCTFDSCDTVSRACVHVFDTTQCCRTDSDCPQAPPGTPVSEEVLYSICTDRRCIARRCLYERDPTRPGCCVSVDHPELGCVDRNPCTSATCDPTAGQQEGTGLPYSACVFNYDEEGDGLNECCEVDADCDDDNVTTVDVCLVDGEGDLAYTCSREPDADYCGPGAASRTCDDGNVCTEDTCCQAVDEPREGCPGLFRCLRTPIPGCCLIDEHCGDGDQCTTDICCLGLGDPHPLCRTSGMCVHEQAGLCCHDDAHCESLKPEELFCKTASCVNGRCFYTDPPIYEGCCLADADCDDGDRCTLEACIDGVCTSTGELTPPACCYVREDCPRDNVPCETNMCVGQECVVVAIPECCDPEDAGDIGPCDDGNPCTEDLCTTDACAPGERCLHGTCRHRPLEQPGCCLSDADCAAEARPCLTAACDTETGRCVTSSTPDCVLPLPYRETFDFPVSFEGDHTLAALGWTKTALEGDAPRDWRHSYRSLLGPSPVADFLPPSDLAPLEVCLRSPALDTSTIEDATAQWKGRLRGAAGGAFRVLAGRGDDILDYLRIWPDPAAGVPVRTDDEGPAHYSAELPEQALGGADTHLLFCARVATSTPNDMPRWSIDDVVVAAGAPPVFAAWPDEPVVVYAENRRWTSFSVTDRGALPDGSAGELEVSVALGPGYAYAGLLPGRSLPGGEGRLIWLSLLPGEADVNPKAELTMVASDGYLTSRRVLEVAVRNSLCGSDGDCDDGDSCTVGRCLVDTQSCHLVQPPECVPPFDLLSPLD